ncbi:unnamed protein product [Paramecium octaurelia]|uniref:Uncharacterized protein n=1 Tax=Paramecium octaurelia TaxID=43137 RepID=A0A8S1YIT2_PAROT|nr:unnamed protein product [Paramecium octaurelia]
MSNHQVQLIKAPDAKYSKQMMFSRLRQHQHQPLDNLKMVKVWIRGGKTQVDPGNSMFGQAVARALASKSQKFQKGDSVIGLANWTLYQTISDAKLHLVQRGGDIDDLTGYSFLGPLGISELTAYVKLEAIGNPKQEKLQLSLQLLEPLEKLQSNWLKHFIYAKSLELTMVQKNVIILKTQLGAHDCIDYNNQKSQQKTQRIKTQSNPYFDNEVGEMLDEI